MQCPVCRCQAENLTPCTLEGVVVSCTTCGDYRISGPAFHEFMRLQTDRRAALLQTAKLTTRSGWPTIGVSSLGSR
jgi:hypothetical protein